MQSYCWIVLHTKPNQEALALENIRRQAFDVYCPMITVTRRHARRREVVKRPLFPGYVFARWNAQNQQWRPLLSTRGVQSVVRFGNVPGVLPKKFVKELAASEQSGELDHMVSPKFTPGDEVVIQEGPFREVIARVLSLPENDRVWLLMDMMGREVRILQKSEALEPVGAV
ncbi:MAG: transcription termination/antitermination protein NusG [Methyloligellaceae bacterium]